MPKSKIKDSDLTDIAENDDDKDQDEDISSKELKSLRRLLSAVNRKRQKRESSVADAELRTTVRSKRRKRRRLAVESEA